MNLISFVPAGKEVRPQNVKQESTAHVNKAISGDEAKAFYESLIGEATESDGSSTSKTKERRRTKRSVHRKSSDGKQAKICKDKKEEKRNHNRRPELCGTLAQAPDAQLSSIHLHREERRLLYFAQSGDIKSIKKLLRNDPNIDINYQDNFGWTALMCAVVASHIDVVDFLLKKGADRLIRNSKNQSACNLAEELGFKSIQEKIDNFSMESKDGETTSKSNPFFCETCKSVFHESTLKEHQTSTLHLFNMNLKPNIDTFMIPSSNIGYRLMKQSGWDGEKGLGPDGKGQRLPVKTVLKRNRYCLGSKLDDKKERITHFGPYDTSATTSTPHGSGRVMSAAAMGRRERRKREQREKEWERNLRQSMDF